MQQKPKLQLYIWDSDASEDEDAVRYTSFHHMAYFTSP